MRRVDREEKRLLILHHAIAAFSEHGYERTSISEIASRAGIATGGVYNYFPNKEALFQACSTRIYEEFTSGVAGMQATSPECTLEHVIRHTLDFFHTNPDYARITLLETKNFAIRFPQSGLLPLWYEKTGAILRTCLATEMPEGSEAGGNFFYIATILGGIESLLVVWIFEPRMLPLSAGEIATRLARMIRRELRENTR